MCIDVLDVLDTSTFADTYEEQQLPGITTKQLVKEVLPTLQINIEGLRSRDRPRHWARWPLKACKYVIGKSV